MSIEIAKKAYEMARDAYWATLVQDGNFPRHEDIASAIGPMAAEIYRSLTRPVIVSVDEPKVTVRQIDELRDNLGKAGFQGIISTGNVTYKFPTDDQIDVTIEGQAE